MKGVEIDTAFFNGNQAPEIAVQGCYIPESREKEVKEPDFGEWDTILGKQDCGPSQRHAWVLPEVTKRAYTHVRLQMFPDGGIARFRLFGHAIPILPQNIETVFDLAATVNGGVAVACSDQHFGTKDNLLLPGRGEDMGDGWETKRSRGRDHVDWVIVKLGVPGIIDRVVVDTAHFRGNFPQKVQIFAAKAPTNAEEAAGMKIPAHDDTSAWTEILTPEKVGPDAEHEFKKALKEVEGTAYVYVKMVIIPDGGVKRLRVFGKRANVGKVVGRAGRV